MKQPKAPDNTTPPDTLLDPHRFPLHAQTEPTASREQVQQVTPVHAPRQSKRPMERTAKKTS